MNDNDLALRHTIGAGGTFGLRTVSGSVSVRGTDTDEAVVVARLSNGGRRHGPPPLSVRRSENALHVEPEQKGAALFGASFGQRGVPSIDFEIELPKGARVEINTVSADVTAHGLAGDQSYRVVSGDLELENIEGRVALVSVSGDAVLRDGGALELEATTTSGDLEVQAQRLDLVRLRSVSGDARLHGAFNAGPEHRVETVSGDLWLEVEGGLTIEASGPKVSLSSALPGRVDDSRGSRGLVIGDGAARLRFRTLSGDVHVDGAGARRAHSRPATPPAPEPPVPPAPPTVPPFDADEPTRAYRATRPDDPPAAAPREPLEVLRALERGEIDVEEATRLLEVTDRG